MSGIEILSEFRNQLIIFFDELITQFPLESDLVIVRLFISNQVPIQKVMDTFTYKINKNDHELRTMVKSRNEAFFLEHSVFEELDQDKVNHFKKLWRSGQLDDDDKDVIWKWIETFIYLSDKFNKLKRVEGS